MLSKGLRDEENEKINRLFNQVQDIEFVPDLWIKQQRELVNRVLMEATGLNLSELAAVETEDLYEKLRQKELSFSNCEQLGDLLMKVLPYEEEENRLKLAEKTVAVYEFVQNESKTFSFTLVQKINAARTEIENLK